jgi:hypothetical protein
MRSFSTYVNIDYVKVSVEKPSHKSETACSSVAFCEDGVVASAPPTGHQLTRNSGDVVIFNKNYIILNGSPSPNAVFSSAILTICG